MDWKIQSLKCELLPFILAMLSDLALSSCAPRSLESASSLLPVFLGGSQLLIILTIYSQGWAAVGRGGLAARLLLTLQVHLLSAFDLEGVRRIQFSNHGVPLACLT